MLKPYALLMLTLGGAAAVLAGDGFRDRMAAAGALCKAGDHAEALAAYTNLAAARADVEERFDALSAAAQCARLHLRNEAQALELCDRLAEEPYRLGCRAVVHQWTGSAAVILEDLGGVDLLRWPERLAATAFMVRAKAHALEKNGRQAVDDYVRAYQLSGGYEKWAALQRLGDVFRQLQDDEILAEACYRKCIAEFGGGWPGLQARTNLGHLLIDQQRYEAALQTFLDCQAPSAASGTWRVTLLLGAARAHQAAGSPDQAIAVLKEALGTHGIAPHQRTEAEKRLTELQGGG